MLVQFLEWKDPPKKKMATQCHILAWKIPWTEEPGGQYSSWGRKESDPTLCYPIDCSMPDFPVHNQLSELAQTHANLLYIVKNEF